MITQDRNGNALPSTVDPGRLAWSARIAYTNGDYLTPSGWTYYELPPSAILQRSRSSVLDGTTWECRLTVLAEAVPELSDLQAYYQLEVDLVDDTGNAWPYHTGPIDSISDRFDIMLAMDWNNVHRFGPEILLDEQDGRVRAERANRFHQLLDQDRRESFARFVNQQQPIIGNQGTGNRQHLLLPARQLIAA